MHVVVYTSHSRSSPRISVIIYPNINKEQATVYIAAAPIGVQKIKLSDISISAVCIWLASAVRSTYIEYSGMGLCVTYVRTTLLSLIAVILLDQMHFVWRHTKKLWIAISLQFHLNDITTLQERRKPEFSNSVSTAILAASSHKIRV
jgi:hypothetical protein